MTEMPPRRERPAAPTWGPDEPTWHLVAITRTSESTYQVTLRSGDGPERDYLFRASSFEMGGKELMNITYREFSQDAHYDPDAAQAVVELVSAFMRVAALPIHLGTPASLAGGP